jgi:hypothetical protein
VGGHASIHLIYIESVGSQLPCPEKAVLTLLTWSLVSGSFLSHPEGKRKIEWELRERIS